MLDCRVAVAPPLGSYWNAYHKYYKVSMGGKTIFVNGYFRNERDSALNNDSYIDVAAAYCYGQL